MKQGSQSHLLTRCALHLYVTMQSLLCDRPYHLEPGFEKPPSDMRDVTNYSDCIRHETLRVAVVDMAQDGAQHRLMPETLRSVVKVRLRQQVAQVLQYMVDLRMAL